MGFLKILFLSFGLFAAGTVIRVQALEAEEIVGGELSPHKKFPYTVFLRVSVPGPSILGVLCSGSILDDYHVITAAHCFVDEITGEWNDDPIHVVAGVTDLLEEITKSSCIKKNVKKVFVPKIYFSSIKENFTTTEGDIAVVQLASSLNLKENSHLKSVKPATKGLFVGHKAVISGYGWSQVETNEGSDGIPYETGLGVSDGKLRFAHTRVISQRDCYKKHNFRDEKGFRHVNDIKDTVLCAQVDQRDPDEPAGICTGDSGGPLVINGETLIGVVNSSPVGCTEDVSPGIYARVTSHNDFISKALRNVKDPEIMTNLLHPVNTDLLDKFSSVKI